MSKWFGALLVFAFLYNTVACAPKAQKDCGFIKNVYGERISWKSDAPVTLRLHTSIPDSVVPAILAAADTWEKTAGKKLFNIITTPRYSGVATPHQDGLNVIYLMDTWESNLASEQARTSVYWIGDQIKESDMRINAVDFGYYWKEQSIISPIKPARASEPQVNIEALVLHELGHVLGLKHKDGAGSVMATYLAGGEDRVSLASIDMSDLQCEY